MEQFKHQDPKEQDPKKEKSTKHKEPKKNKVLFGKHMYLDYDWKKIVIAKSIQEGTLDIGATNNKEREKVIEHMLCDDREDIIVSTGTGGYFSEYILHELHAIEKKLLLSDKQIHEVFGGSGGCLAALTWLHGYTDQRVIDYMTDVPEEYLKDWTSSKNNMTYIAGAKMMPFACTFSFNTSNENIQLKQNDMIDFLMLHYETILDDILLYKAGGSLKASNGFLPENILSDIVTKIVCENKDQFEMISGLCLEDHTHTFSISCNKKLFKETSDLYNKATSLSVLIAVKEDSLGRDNRETKKINTTSSLPILDAIMISSNLGEPFPITIDGVIYKAMDPYFTTKTAAEQQVSHFAKKEKENAYHLALTTLNRYRYNPSDRGVGFGGEIDTEQRFYADAVLAPDFEEIYSMHPYYRPEIRKVIAEFMGIDYKAEDSVK